MKHARLGRYRRKSVDHKGWCSCFRTGRELCNTNGNYNGNEVTSWDSGRSLALKFNTDCKEVWNWRVRRRAGWFRDWSRWRLLRIGCRYNIRRWSVSGAFRRRDFFVIRWARYMCSWLANVRTEVFSGSPRLSTRRELTTASCHEYHPSD